MLLTKNVLVNAINFVLWSLSDGASFFLYVTKEFLQINNLSCACLGCGYFCFRDLGTDVRKKEELTHFGGGTFSLFFFFVLQMPPVNQIYYLLIRGARANHSCFALSARAHREPTIYLS